MPETTAIPNRRQELVAEYVVLAAHDALRSRRRYDYGAGQRAHELRRRRMFLRDRGAGELVDRAGELYHELDPNELLAAFERVGLPRARRQGRMRNSSWMDVLYHLAQRGAEVLPEREQIERENGSPLHFESALEVYCDRQRI